MSNNRLKAIGYRRKLGESLKAIVQAKGNRQQARVTNDRKQRFNFRLTPFAYSLKNTFASRLVPLACSRLTPHASRLNKGFSIVELIVIMAIFGLLVSMAIPNFLPSRNLSKVKAAIGISDQIRAALYMYSNEYMNKQGTVPFVYPTASSMGNLDAVYSVLSPWMATNVKGQLGGSGYISYQVNAGRDMYTFSVKAGNSENTPVTATRESVTGVYAGEAVPYP